MQQRRGHAGAHLAGADDQHVAAGQRAQAIGGHLDGGVADRRRAAPDAGLGAGPLADPHGVAEQQVERGAGAAVGAGELPGDTDLTEDLALAEDGRVEPGGHLEEVAGRGIVVLGEQERVQVVGVPASRASHRKSHDVGVGAVEALGDGVHLGAVHVLSTAASRMLSRRTSPTTALPMSSRGDRQPFEHGQRTRAVVHTDDDDRHVAISLRLGVRGLARRCSW